MKNYSKFCEIKTILEKNFDFSEITKATFVNTLHTVVSTEYCTLYIKSTHDFHVLLVMRDDVKLVKVAIKRKFDVK